MGAVSSVGHVSSIVTSFCLPTLFPFCANTVGTHVYAHAYASVHTHAYHMYAWARRRMQARTCGVDIAHFNVQTYIEMFEICIDMCMDMCIDVCEDMCIDTCMDMCLGAAADACTNMRR